MSFLNERKCPKCNGKNLIIIDDYKFTCITCDKRWQIIRRFEREDDGKEVRVQVIVPMGDNQRVRD